MRQLHVRTITRRAHVVEVDHQTTVVVTFPRIFFAASQHGAYPREQFFDRKWLADVIVSADVEARDAIGLSGFSCQHNDWCAPGLGFTPQPAADLYAAHSGKHQVQENYGRRVLWIERHRESAL